MGEFNTAVLKKWLEKAANQYNRPNFIADDPISIPHAFSRQQDREIMGFWTAILSWGQRKTIISKARELVGYMDGAPYDFILGHRDSDLKRMLAFRHRTFNDVDLLYFMAFFQHHYRAYDSLEEAFTLGWNPDDDTVEQALNGFYTYFFSLDVVPQRTRKHVSAPLRKSTCKRLNMFLRWMVRNDEKGVDFGIWHTIRPDQLVIPLDVHVERIGRRTGLITRKQRDWQTAVELTHRLRQFDPADPVRYDFALFGAGVLEKSPF